MNSFSILLAISVTIIFTIIMATKDVLAGAFTADKYEYTPYCSSIYKLYIFNSSYFFHST